MVVDVTMELMLMVELEEEFLDKLDLLLILVLILVVELERQQVEEVVIMVPLLQRLMLQMAALDKVVLLLLLHPINQRVAVDDTVEEQLDELAAVVVQDMFIHHLPQVIIHLVVL